MQQDIGTLLHIHLDEIKPGQPTQAHPFLIASAAKAINDAGGRNWMPVIVKQTGAESFQAIANTFILAAAEEAGINKVWCIIADDTEATQNCAQLLAQEKIPRINLTTASREEIKLGLDYLIHRPVNPLLGVTLATALEKIDVPQRQSWKASLNEITSLKCGITKGKKLDIFKEVFYVTPSSNEIEASKKDRLDKRTVAELRKIAQERGIVGTSKMKKADLLKALSDS